jgi:regulator-associated protein of mTOR
MLGAVVLSRLMQNYRNGQQLGLKNNLVCICLEQLANASPPYKQWLTLCLAQLWADYDKARWVGVRDTAHEKLYLLLEDKIPEVIITIIKLFKEKDQIRKNKMNFNRCIVIKKLN